MKHLTVALFIQLLAFNVASAIENQYAGARAVALSNAYVSIYDTWSVFHNQAGISTIHDIKAGLYYESRFMVDEFSLMAGMVVLPTQSGVFGLSFTQFGTGTFKENKFGLAYSRQLSSKISAGIQFDYFMSKMPENKRSKGFATVEGGVIYQPTPELNLGFHIFNPVEAGLKTLNRTEKMPATVRLGGSYTFSGYVLACFEWEGNSQYDLQYRVGLEFLPAENLALRFGASGKPFIYTAGIGYTFKNMVTDIGFHYHGNLGITPAISIQFLF